MTHEPITQNRITDLFAHKQQEILSLYFTAGFPELNDTVSVLHSLQAAGVNLVEIGMPYSDPVADGETVQLSNMRALSNGMTLKILFEQLADCRQSGVSIPILLMGYINPVLQFGVEAFCRQCREVGVDGVILPDLPLDLYTAEYKAIFDQYGIQNIFMITPQTTESRIRMIDEVSEGFIYTVSSASITGSQTGVSDTMLTYFNRIHAMSLRNPRLIGFGIKDKETFDTACQYANGAIVGSAFVRQLEQHGSGEESIKAFVDQVRGN